MLEAEELEPRSQFEEDMVHLFKSTPSVCLLVEGRRGTGKTDLDLLIAEILLMFGIIKNVATNINILSETRIKKINSLEDLRYWCKQTQGKNLFIGDEWGKAMRRRTPMSALNIAMMDDLQTLRKFGPLSIILSFPAEKYVDNSSLGSDIVDVIIEKPVFNNPKIATYYDLMENISWDYEELPRTMIKFDTYDPAPFTLKSPNQLAQFKDEDKQLLWNWTHQLLPSPVDQATRKRLERIRMKFVKETLERERES